MTEPQGGEKHPLVDPGIPSRNLDQEVKHPEGHEAT